MRLVTALVFAFFAFAAAVQLNSEPARANAAQIDADARATLDRFFQRVVNGRELANKAEAILIFPSIVKAGIGIGGEYGEGVLHVRGRTSGYYNIIGASIGFQLGVQTRSVIIMFMTPAALAGFQARAGWEVGVDGSVALINVGASGRVNTDNILDPIIGFVFNNKGLMYNLTLEGTKISRFNPN
ncbi:MAG: YSC84-related protein [Hyphomicrobiaceae bacterium]|nr:YSC84-related protein [Hyphomicrobiaceae bacterium]